MPDVLASTSTTAGIAVGGTVSNEVEAIGDHDWFAIQLVAGQTVTISLNGAGSNPLSDPYLYLRDSAGNILIENDDSGPGLNSRVIFTPSTSGTYYIDVGAWEDRTFGTYQLSVSPYTAPPIWTLDQIAGELVTGYWGGTSQHFAVSAGGTLTVNIGALTPDGQFFARAALGLWSDVTGIRFVEVTSGGQIVFDDNEDGAFSTSTVQGGIITSSNVNVSTDWISGDGRNLDTYSLQTYVHEIGHALGLGHAGDYNNTAEYPLDALYSNDSWSNSVMSYFSQQENDYFRAQGYTYNYVLTPMAADILGMSMLYGLSTTTRTGDTTYGFNSNAGRVVFDASQYPRAAYAIFDNGGIDTLNYSGFANNQVINLNAESFSSVGGSIGNVVIARGTVIENAIGGSGIDQLIGNSVSNVLNGGAGNDILTGGAGPDALIGGSGNDLFQDTAGNLNGDTIADLSAHERILITDATLSGFASSLSGNVLAFTGGSITLANGPSFAPIAIAAASGGVQLRWDSIRNDFNGDGRSDLILQNGTGAFTIWRGDASGALIEAPGLAANAVDASWKISATGDFNGDGREDILWRHSSGVIGEWLGQTGAFANNSGVAANLVDNSWTVARVADFNGDGRDDILWRHSSGEIGEWIGQQDGSFANNGGAAANQVDSSWSVVAAGDFNGDGFADVLWRHTSGVYAEWQGTSSGALANKGGVMSGATGSVVGSGDFNGDGLTDLITRVASGAMTVWLGQTTGQFTALTPNQQLADPNWTIASIGDFNGDGVDDLLWKHTSGSTGEWLGRLDGNFAYNGAAQSVPTGWSIQSPDIFIA